MAVAVLAVQGAFIEHIEILKSLGVQTFELRQKNDLQKSFDGLILPGGESTAMGKLLVDLDMLPQLQKLIADGLPVFGTCAGMILLAKQLENDARRHIGTMDIKVKRNAYGRQLGSFNIKAAFGDDKVEMPFIRAPFISECGKDVQVLSVVEGKIVAAQQGNQLVTAFHPELTQDYTVHRHFLSLIK